MISVGKPFFENIQYNSPIDIYDDDTVDEMVKIMNSNQAAAAANQAAAPAAPAAKANPDEEYEEAVSNLGWSVRTATKTLIKPNSFPTAGKSVAWSSDM